MERTSSASHCQKTLEILAQILFPMPYLPSVSSAIHPFLSLPLQEALQNLGPHALGQYTTESGQQYVHHPSIPRFTVNNMTLAKLEAFITGFSSARDRAAAFDERITNAAREVSDEVADLVAVTTRTVMASMDITCGSSDASEVMFFVNGMGSTHESNSPHTARCVGYTPSRRLRLTNYL